MSDISIQSLSTAFLLTLLAGLGTALGSLASLLPHAREAKFLAGALGFSAGVMLYVSFLDLMPEAIASLSAAGTPGKAEMSAVIAFFTGIAIIALIDLMIPQGSNPHEYNSPPAPHRANGKRQSILLALAIGIHNFPEGMATFVSALDGASVAVPIVIAIMLHNIPEGIAVAVPVLHATGSKRKAFTMSLLSGLAEPIGAMAGMLLLLNYWSAELNALLLAGVAGVMVYISLDELLPTAENHGHHHITIAGVLAGMAVMATSILCI